MVRAMPVDSRAGARAASGEPTAVGARVLIELSNLGAQLGRHGWTHTASVDLPGLAQVLQRETRPGLEDVQRVDLFQVAIQFFGLASA